MKNKIFEGTGIMDPDILKEIIDKNENLIVIDSQEVYIQKHYDELKKKGYDVHVLNLKNLNRSESWNILDYPYTLYKNGDIDKTIDILDSITNTITYESASIDNFWSITSADLIQGIILGLFADCEYSRINFKSIWQQLESINEKYMDSDKLSIYFKHKNSSDLSYMKASTTINAPQDTKNSIVAVAKSKLMGIAARNNLLNIISGNNIKIENFAKEKQALFIIHPEIPAVYNLVIPIFINELEAFLMDKNNPKCNILISNLNYIPYICNLEKFLQPSNSRNIAYSINIVSKDKYKEIYDIRSIDNMEMGNTVDINSKIAFTKYPETTSLDLETFALNKYFEEQGIKDSIITCTSDIIKEVDKKIDELERREG